MKSLIFASMLLLGTFAVAGDKTYENGSLKEMTSVECGVDQKSGTSFVGDLLGTDSAHSQAMKKDRMVLRVPEGDNKEREYDVVSMTPVAGNSAMAAKK